MAAVLLTLLLPLQAFAQQPSPKKKLFVMIQGVNTSLSEKEAAANNGMGSAPSFSVKRGVEAIVPFLKNNGFNGARFLTYSYKGAKSNGNPLSYSCLDTFTTPKEHAGSRPIAAYAQLLGKQINSALSGDANTDVYLIAHSQGGVVAFSYLSALVHGPNILALPGGLKQLKGVITLDSPIGGVSSNKDYLLTARTLLGFSGIRLFDIGRQCSELQDVKTTDTSLADMASLFDSASGETFPADDVDNGEPLGARASVLHAIWGSLSENNQGLAKEAEGTEASQVSGGDTRILTIGNTNDFLWRPSQCTQVLKNLTEKKDISSDTRDFLNKDQYKELKGADLSKVDFVGTQWLEDEADGKVRVYSRQFTGTPDKCNSLRDIGPSHSDAVLNNNDVEQGLVDFLQGRVPTSLKEAPTGPEGPPGP